MIEQVYKNIYMMEIPLPNNPLRSLNSYVILSEGRNLIIDTGFNKEECKDAFMEGLRKLNIDLNHTDVLITHLHADHCGLASELTKMGARIYAGEKDGQLINKMSTEEYWRRFDELSILYGLTQDNITYEDHPGYKYCPKEPVKFNLLKEGDMLQLGNYSFKVIDIPGHTPGQIGLYEEAHKLFFCGDHILDKITPNITFWGFEWDILSVYFNSLIKVYKFDIEYLFTAHRNIVKDHRRRIDELLKHHENRLAEILKIIEDGPKTVRNVAANMHWELKYENWGQFPNPQKWFASGEAMSHLEHLEAMGKAQKFYLGGALSYKRV